MGGIASGREEGLDEVIRLRVDFKEDFELAIGVFTYHRPTFVRVKRVEVDGLDRFDYCRVAHRRKVVDFSDSVQKFFFRFLRVDFLWAFGFSKVALEVALGKVPSLIVVFELEIELAISLVPKNLGHIVPDN